MAVENLDLLTDQMTGRMQKRMEHTAIALKSGILGTCHHKDWMSMQKGA